MRANSRNSTNKGPGLTDGNTGIGLWVHSKEISRMDNANTIGRTVTITKEISRTDCDMAKGSSNIMTEAILKDSSEMIRSVG